MKFSKLAVLGAALALATTFAKADSITGSLGVSNGSDTWNGTTSISFDGAPYNVTTATGSFMPLKGDSVTFEPTLNFANPTGLLFTVPPSLASFTIDTFSVLSQTSTFYAIEGTGTYTLGGDSEVGTYIFSTSLTDGSSTFQFTGGATAAATPEPSSLMLLGSGLVSAAGMVLRRRRTV